MNAHARSIGTDRDLVEAVLDLGDEQAFRELYRRHTPRLLGFVSRLIVRPDPEYEDVIQETWIRAYDRLGQFRWQSTFSTWLLGIGLNVARDSLRRSRKTRTVPEERLADCQGAHLTHETRIDIEHAIRMLPDDCRMVLVLHDVEGMKHHEIATRLGIPVGTTKSRLFRARRMIRDWLSEEVE